MVKYSHILSILSIALISCGKQEQPSSLSASKKSEKPCNIKVTVNGKAPKVHFKLFSKASEKTVTIDKQLDLLDDQKDEFSFSSLQGGKISCSVKTTDSYGPEVTIKIFVNNKLWQEASDSYHPKIEGTIPLKLK